MEAIINDIRKRIEQNQFLFEEHIRFCVVTRILQSLGWNVWNPNECFYEYPVKKFPLNHKNKEENGKVDIALFISENFDRTPEVFIETKALHKLTGDFTEYEEQLQRYNYYDSSAISVLTDGVIWKFYLPSAGGTFSQKLFNELNLIKDPVNFIEEIFKKVLFKDNFRKNAVHAGETMLAEQKIVKDIDTIKEEALKVSHILGDNIYLTAQKILKNRFNKEYELKDIERFWDRKLVNTHDKTEDTITVNILNNEINGKEIDLHNFDPTGKKPKRVFIIDQWYEVKYWISIYFKIAQILIDKFPDTDLCGFLQTENIWPKLNVSKMDNGKYLFCNLNAKECIKKSIKFLENNNYDISRNFRIEV